MQLFVDKSIEIGEEREVLRRTADKNRKIQSHPL